MPESNDDKGYYAFENIRYALAPTGERRFSKPVAPPVDYPDAQASWLRPPICPQAYPSWMCNKHATTYKNGHPTTSSFALEWCRKAEEKVMRDLRQTEDCLFLDVYVPRAVFENDTTQNRCPDHALAPIVVSFGTTPFIYGSKAEIGVGGPSPAMLTQHSPYPDEDSCATQYPIVVSINYRLGMFGWLHGKDSTANLGLWDQRLALEWVRQHAQTFGGDWDRITVVGMGSGGGSVMHQVTAFGGKPNPNHAWYYQNDTTPFQRAIIMSPNWHFTPDFKGTFLAVMNAATNMTGSPISTVAQLKDLHTHTLMDINRKVVKEAPLNHDMFGPIAGGEFTPKHPSALLRDKQIDPDLKVIVGRGLYHHLRTAPFGATAKEVHDQMPGLLHGYSNETLDYIVNRMYSGSAAEELAQWYNGKRSKRLSSSVFPPAIRDELHVMEEVMVGCNTRNLARAWPTTYAYDALDFSPNAMMGLFSTHINHPPMDNIAKPYSFRERFLRFIVDGKPSFLGAWKPYGNTSNLLEKDPKDPSAANMRHDIYDNTRCNWWVYEGYEKWQRESGADNWFKG